MGLFFIKKNWPKEPDLGTKDMYLPLLLLLSHLIQVP